MGIDFYRPFISVREETNKGQYNITFRVTKLDSVFLGVDPGSQGADNLNQSFE